MKWIEALLASSNDIRHDIKKSNGTGFGAEAPRDFLLNLGETNISFGLVVIKGHGKILRKQAYVSLKFTKAVQKTNRFTPLRLSIFRLRRTFGMLSVSLVQEIVVLLLKALQNILGKGRNTLQDELFSLTLHVPEQVAESRSPFVSVILLDPVQFSQEMNATKGMTGLPILEI